MSSEPSARRDRVRVALWSIPTGIAVLCLWVALRRIVRSGTGCTLCCSSPALTPGVLAAVVLLLLWTGIVVASLRFSWPRTVLQILLCLLLPPAAFFGLLFTQSAYLVAL